MRALALAALLAALPGCQGNIGEDRVSFAFTRIASVSTGGVQGDADTQFTSISADGRYVAWHSPGRFYHPDDTDSISDVFVRDMTTGDTILASRATGLAGAKTNGGSTFPSLSADGRYVAFQTGATNLDPADSDFSLDIYVRDLQTGVNVLCSRATGAAGAKGNASSFSPSLSGDGRYVAYQTAATNLDPDDADPAPDIYIRDLSTDTTYLVSRDTAGAKAVGFNQDPHLSSDGTVICFTTDAVGLDAADTNGYPDVYARDWSAGSPATRLVSRETGAAGPVGDSPSSTPAISADGRYVAFVSLAQNLAALDNNGASDVFVRDLLLDVTVRATVDSFGNESAGGGGVSISISGDGRFVVFSSGATNLVEDDTNKAVDVFIRDLVAGTTRRISVATYGAETNGSGSSDRPSLSRDGRYVVFSSFDNSLVETDTNGKADAFLRGPLY